MSMQALAVFCDVIRNVLSKPALVADFVQIVHLIAQLAESAQDPQQAALLEQKLDAMIEEGEFLEDGMKYANGNKYDGNKTIPGVVFWITYSSNGRTIYTAIKYADGDTSCDCPGWTRGSRGVRDCRHTKIVRTMTESKDDTGTAVIKAPPVPTVAASDVKTKCQRPLTFYEE